MQKKVFTSQKKLSICKRAQWSAEAEYEAQVEGAKWVGRPAGNSGS